ncbi:3-oxoacyl-ACP synthase III family protein [Streptomyces sp. NPDC088400]|uniref:3-oxoacyl-ACP synthase III family protein n=1 Tax=Streptomyces sp. NPDC088400 TaxID=3365861 RepID=UPI00380216F9
MPVGILGLGFHVPEVIVDNSLISKWADVPEDWVARRTGIYERRYTPAGVATSDLAHEAVTDLLSRAPGAERDIGLVIVATATPDQPQPATAVALQSKLGLEAAAAFDVNAVCSGFVYGLTIAGALLSSSAAYGTHALVVGSDMFSSVMDRGDRKTVSLFGDGAGAALLGPVPEGYGIGASRMVAHGSLRSLVEVPAGGTRKPLTPEARAAGEHLFKMDGRPVTEYALRTLPEIIGAAVADCGLSIEDIDQFIFHQANVRLLEKITSELKLDPDRVPITAAEYGNTGAASIPITMRKAQMRRPFQRGERILLAAVGGGMTAAATVLTWF